MTAAQAIGWLRASLRARLLLIALVGSALSALAGGVVMHHAARQQTEALHDRNLADVAQTILRFAQHELLEIQADQLLAGGAAAESDSDFDVDARYRFQIWRHDGRQLLRSVHAPAERMLARRDQVGFGSAEINGETYRTYAHVSPQTGMQVQMAEPVSERAVALGAYGGDTLLVFGGAFVPLFACLAWALWLAVRPVAATARQVAERGPADWQRLDEASVPLELRPMTSAINGLLHRIEQAVQRERDFNAVAAHEMRTPLAALRMQAQVALRAHDEAQRRDSLRLLTGGVDRCAHLIDQLLTLARVDAANDAAAGRDEAVELPAVIGEVLQDLGGEARRRRIDVRTRCAAVTLRGHRFGLRTLIANLLGNAMRYTPDAGTVSIEADARPDGVWLTVDDSGAGIPAKDRERVFERFRRLRSEGNGAGLGLSIVQAVARAHRASIKLGDAPLGGLRVQVHFPAAG